MAVITESEHESANGSNRNSDVVNNKINKYQYQINLKLKVKIANGSNSSWH